MCAHTPGLGYLRQALRDVSPRMCAPAIDAEMPHHEALCI